MDKIIIYKKILMINSKISKRKELYNNINNKLNLQNKVKIQFINLILMINTKF